MSIGIPIKLLHEAEKHIITIEMKTGEVYRGTLIDSEDNMNCQISNVQYTSRDGRMTELEHAFIRGSKIRFVIIPDMLKNAPMFKRVDPKNTKNKAIGLGRGSLRGRGGLFFFFSSHLKRFFAFLFIFFFIFF
eukprot:TRINITY_DN15285_c0_g1_i1.p1 TRINITY_DN15285_c0_g1~~TRINITY_DN15285_c0_g1_i1.p1  ORF type:complete len:133 (+),score=27.67 TRINITY_DN15285_c0_g1_i1:114-512(+)